MNKDERIRRINLYSCGMMNHQILRHPLKVPCVVNFHSLERDIYDDLTNPSEPELSKKKFCILQNDKNLQFVPDISDMLRVEDEDNPHWSMVLTISKLPRLPKAGDTIDIELEHFKSLYHEYSNCCLSFDKITFEISDVKPINSRINSILICICHPTKDTFNINPL